MAVGSSTEERLRDADELANQEGNEDTEKIVLTDRELAIIAGEDPDEVGVGSGDTHAADGEDTLDGGDGTADVTDDDEAGKDAPEPDQDEPEENWVTDELKQLAATYELDEDDIKDAGSEEQFLKSMSLLEKLSLKAAQRQWQAQLDAQKSASQGNASPTGKVDDAGSGDPRTAASGLAVSEGAEAKAEGAALKLEDRIKKLRDEGYDESLIEPLEAMAAEFRELQGSLGQIKPVIDSQQQRYIADRQVEINDKFHSTVDVMGGRFGGAEEPLTPEQDAAREKLFNAARLVERDILERGQQLPGMGVVLKRAELLAFGDELRAERQAELAKQVKSQAGKRRSAGRTVTQRSKPPGDSDDPVSAIANSPEMIELFKSFDEK